MQQETFTQASLKELTEYVVARHHAFLRRQLPAISELFQSAQDNSSTAPATVADAGNIFTTVRTKIETHLRDEEQFLFPNGVSLAEGGVAEVCELDLKGRLEEMEREHDNAGLALENCRRLLINEASTDSKLKELVIALTSLIDDLSEHVRIENTYIHPILKKYL
ncbi:MAG TPA: hemerythrin domain-containing protein [Candidatus Obscuribacter sp.]|nr:hemerythrin domain-containing protein [Candidatus Obscuribacter sp.]MBK9281615.1 hemerythrin domain-containing protein [Candidatus Obscuribacter sp.]MBL8084628.1 hemerythrin domain-containing protein [Candidatus Obscuribacter sp.]HMW91085.1 hemerythrin domain-containing protein [Candidatus Obscuribacter sp.]HMY55983.1 hemerythrin domain-containing protein [Candidatus Obscuribacter sp.]